MKLLLLDTKGCVHKVEGEYSEGGLLNYICTPLTWKDGSYTQDQGLVESCIVPEDAVEIIDTNEIVIRVAKDRMMGFE